MASSPGGVTMGSSGSIVPFQLHHEVTRAGKTLTEASQLPGCHQPYVTVWG
jgi:hypothetical protein